MEKRGIQNEIYAKNMTFEVDPAVKALQQKSTFRSRASVSAVR